MPTILQINTYDGGSTGVIARNINLTAAQKGWMTYLYYGRDSYHKDSFHNEKKISSGIVHKIGILNHVIFTRLFDKHGYGSKYDTKKLITEIEKINPDIIHLHNIHGYYINCKELFSYLRKANIPVVWTLHDCWPFTGHCSHFEFAKCDRWKSGCYNCPEKRSYPSSLLDNSRQNYIEKRELFTSVKELTIVAVSNWLGSIVKKSYLKDYDIEVIQNGIDVNTFMPDMGGEIKKLYNIPADKKVVLGVASPWTKRKGFEDFIHLSDLLPKYKYQIVMIGLSDKQQKNMPKSIIGLSRTSSAKELAQWYSLADVFVNLTYEDSFPTTNLESISCGTPVVTYKTGGSPESITLDTGCVIDKGDLDGVACAVRELCRKERETIRMRCREYAVAHFDKTDCFNKYLCMYEKLINKS